MFMNPESPHSPLRSSKRRKLNRDSQPHDKKVLNVPNRSGGATHNFSDGVLKPGKVYYPRSFYDPYVNCFPVSTVRTKFPSMYIPSTFTHAVLNWRSSFPIDSPLVSSASKFHVMDKSVDRLSEDTVTPDPEDINFRYNVKVMLLHCPDVAEVIKETCESAQIPNESEHLQRQSKLIRFLVGLKGVNELIGIGGYWSPSLDGPNPEEDPSVLIKTAIRCTKSLADIDLSACTQWYKFLEINYLRPEKVHKNSTVPEHVETTVIFLPDVWNCMPSASQWKELTSSYKTCLETKLNSCKKQEAFVPNSEQMECEEGAEVVITVDEVLGDSNDSETEKNKETPTTKVLTEADIEKMKEFYKLPSEPAIVVHPSKTAKNNNFDCCLISLYTLLDYSMEDTKEHTFELSMFGECFDEMLSRDHSFRILKALTNLKITPCLNKANANTKTAEKPEDAQLNSTVARKRLHSGTNSVPKNADEKTANSAKMGKNPLVDKFGYFVDAPAYETTDPLLLLSFNYFDLARSNIIKSKHLSNILYMTGLGLTRTEVTKYVNNVSLHSSVQYRNLTDEPVGGPPIFEKENTSVVPSLLSRRVELPASAPVKDVFDAGDRVVSFEGRTLDMRNLLHLLDNFKEEKNALEIKITKLELDLDAAKKLNKDNEHKNKKLSHEVSTLKQHLSDKEKSLNRMKSGYSKYKRFISHTRKVLKTLIHEDFMDILGPDEMKKFDDDVRSGDGAKDRAVQEHKTAKHSETKSKDMKGKGQPNASNSDNTAKVRNEKTKKSTTGSDYQSDAPNLSSADTEAKHHTGDEGKDTGNVVKGDSTAQLSKESVDKPEERSVNAVDDPKSGQADVKMEDATQRDVPASAGDKASN